MYCVTVPKTIIHILTVFQYFGLWDVGKTCCSTTVKLLLFLFYVSFPLSIVAGAIGNSNVHESIYLADASITVTVQVVRMFYIIFRKTEILSLIQQVGSNNIEDLDEFNRVNDKMIKLMKFAFYLVLIILIVFVFALVFYAMAERPKLPFDIALPWDWKNTKIGYWTAYSYFTVEVMFSTVVVTLNIIIWYLMLNYSIKFELIGNQLMRLGTPNTQNSFLKDLIKAVETHQNLRQQIDEFQSSFSSFFFSQLLTTGMSISTSVYILVLSSYVNIFQSSLAVVILCHNIFDIFMVMYLANEIKLSSERLSHCLFDSKWMEQSQTCKKYMIIVLEVLKQPERLVIASLWPLNLEAFTSVLRAAYSMFNILRNFN